MASAGCMQVCTSLQADNHASTPPLSFLQAKCPFCRPTNSNKALKGYNLVIKSRCSGNKSLRRDELQSVFLGSWWIVKWWGQWLISVPQLSQWFEFPSLLLVGWQDSIQSANCSFSYLLMFCFGNTRKSKENLCSSCLTTCAQILLKHDRKWCAFVLHLVTLPILEQQIRRLVKKKSVCLCFWLWLHSGFISFVFILAQSFYFTN